MKPSLSLVATAALSLAAALIPAGDDDVVLRGEDLQLTRADYGRWLVERHGTDFLDDWVTEEVVMKEARATDKLPTEAEIEKAWLTERDLIVEHNYSGSLELFDQDLQSQGTDLEQYETRRKRGITMELALLDMAREARTFSEDQLRRRYKDIFGSYGEAISLEALFYSAYSGVDPDGPRPDVAELRKKALERAGQAADALRAGTPFAELLAGSDPPSEELVQQGFLRDGKVTQYRKNLLGAEVERAVSGLDEAGQVAAPIATWDGAWVVRLTRREPMTFEAAHDELLRILREDNPTAEEIGNVVMGLRAKYGVEVSLR
ncbi:MAG: hypothetical protein H6825_15655 [Planctomycetes bacterium]|nr:hypothetical protein [Planctomycetota bacterium]